jgi:serine/threonine-protein kinase
MAEVFLARLEGPEGGERQVVIKKILRRWSHNADVLSLFRDEARIGARLDHHNVVQVLDYGRSGEDTYLVLEYVAGRNLSELITAAAGRGRYLPAITVCFVVSECCSALDHIHGRTDRTGEALSVVHRDINPANVLLSQGGEVKLTDFGVAAGLHRELKTAHGILRGTFPYMSPEQTRCRPLDGRSDIFSLGICLYEALTARHPFADDEDYLTIKNIQDLSPPPPDEHRGDLDGALCAIVMRCLEKDPDDRYQTARKLQDDLTGWLRAKRATYGAGRLARLMTECFPGPLHAEKPDEDARITLGPTSPGRTNPLLDLSLLDRRGPQRIGGAIEPSLKTEQEVPPAGGLDETPVTEIEAGPDSTDDRFVPSRAPRSDFLPEFTASADDMPVIRTPLLEFDDVQRRQVATERSLKAVPRGPMSMDRVRTATLSEKRPPGRWAWVPWVALLTALTFAAFWAITNLR